MARVNPRVDVLTRNLLAAISSSILSAAVYYWLAPFLSPTLSRISRRVDSFPWWAPAIVKLVESALLSTTTLSNRTLLKEPITTAWDAALVGTIARTPFLHLLYSSYSVPWLTIATLFLVDLTSLVVPQYFLATSVPPHTPYDDIKLSSYTTLMSATFISLPVYYLSIKVLPMTMATYFDKVTSLEVLPLPSIIALNLPAGYSLQALLARYGVKGLLAAAANVLITGTGMMYYGISGAEVKGVEIVNTMWMVSIGVSAAATYGFVFRK